MLPEVIDPDFQWESRVAAPKDKRRHLETKGFYRVTLSTSIQGSQVMEDNQKPNASSTAKS